jgi:ketosteroid isomerase-like protein
MNTGYERRISKMVLGTAVCGCFAALLLASGCSQVAAVDPAASVDAVRAADAQWSKAAAANDVEGTIAFYSDDAVVLPPNVAMAMDKGAERKEWADILAPGTNLSWTAGKIESSKSGDLVYDVGIYTLITKAGKGKVTTDGGKYLAVWKKQADGKWKAVAATWNSDKALPGKAAKG